MKKINNLIIHCSVSSWGDVTAIREWHLARGWRNIGYNAVILNGRTVYDIGYREEYDGILQEGRALNFDKYIDSDERAAHALGYNDNSVGVCLIGKEKFTMKQFYTLISFCKVFKAINPDIEIIGHYEVNSDKTCPNFNVRNFRKLLNYKDNELDEYIKNIMPV